MLALMMPLVAPFFDLPVMQEDSEVMAGLLIMVIVSIVVIAIWIWVLMWVYRDAKERGMEAALWLLVVLLAGMIGLIIYLIVRHEKRSSLMAPSYPYPPPQYYPPYQGYQQPYYPQQQYQQPYYQDPGYGQPPGRYPPRPPEY